MARKVFISVLGTGFYGSCKYTSNAFVSSETRFIQEATIEYLMVKEWTDNDTAIFLLTDKAKEYNWDVKERRNFKTDKVEEYNGLKYVLEEMNLPFISQEVPIKDGTNESEMWNIFQNVFSKLEDNDELYFDLTHSFRYIPMLVLVLGNYAKFLKNVKICSITYGNYEARNQDTNEAPIIDLLPLSALQDWTYAAGQYLESGNAKKLVDLSMDFYKPILRETQGKDDAARSLETFSNLLQKVTEERKNCRGMDIIKSNNFKKLYNCTKEMASTIIKPLNPIMEKIKESFDGFDPNENVANTYATAKWCFDNGMLQSSATILQEGVVSFFCLRHEIDIYDEDRREIVNSAFAIKFNKIPEENWKGDRVKIKEIMNDDLFKNNTLVNLFGSLTIVRNDFNHSGMRSRRTPLQPTNIRNNINKCLEGFKSLFKETSNVD